LLSYSAENVEATYIKARIGLAFPILFNWVKAAKTSVSGWMVLNLLMMTSTASMTWAVS
jgi:hypothetical protein